MHGADDLVVSLGDLNGHVRGHIEGSKGACGGHGVGQRNSEGNMSVVLPGERFCVKYKGIRERKGVRQNSDWEKGSVMSHFLLTIVEDVLTELARSVLSELLYVDDSVLMSETINRLMDKLVKWKEAFERNL